MAGLEQALLIDRNGSERSLDPLVGFEETSEFPDTPSPRSGSAHAWDQWSLRERQDAGIE